MIDENAELFAIADRLYKVTNDLIAEGHKPFAVAAVHVMVAMQMYKTSLSEEEYNLMVDSISQSRDKIKSLNDISVNSSRSMH
jgi:hypothetical protein